MAHLSATGSVIAEELTYDGTLHEISTDAGVLRYREAGEGPPLLLLHSSGPGVTGWRNFRGILGTFAKHFRCLILEVARIPQLRALSDDRGQAGVRRHRGGLPAPTQLGAPIPFH